MAVKEKTAKRSPAKRKPAPAPKGRRAAPPAPRPARAAAPAVSRRPKAPAPELPSRIVFDAVSWKAVAKGAREKALERGGYKLRLLELLRSFEESAWCLKGHAGVVLEGELQLVLEEGVARYGEGEGFLLLPGEDRHRARVVTKRVLLLLVDLQPRELELPVFS